MCKDFPVVGENTVEFSLLDSGCDCVIFCEALLEDTFPLIYFGQPLGGLGFFIAAETAFSQFLKPVIFNRSGAGPFVVFLGGCALAFIMFGFAFDFSFIESGF